MNNEMEYSDQFKVLLVGDQEVGKTQLLNRILNKQFDSEYKGTSGVDNFRPKIITYQNKQFTLQIGDTSGNPRLDNIIRSYFRVADIILLVIAGKDKATKTKQISTWLDKFSEQGVISNIVIIENKSDEPDNVPLDDNDLAQFHDHYDLFITCSAKSEDCESKLISTFHSVFAIMPKFRDNPSRQDSIASASAAPLATIQHMPNRNLHETTCTNINNLSRQEADSILISLHDLLIFGHVHAKHYKINFGKGKPIDNTIFGEQNTGKMIIVPEHVHRWITMIRGALRENSQNREQLLSQLYTQINDAAANKPFTRNATTQDFYQHCLPGFIEECLKPDDGDVNHNYFTILDNINRLEEANVKTIIDELISHLEQGRLGKLPNINARYNVSFFGGKTHKLLQSEEGVKVPDHVASLLDYLINEKKSSANNKLIFALNYTLTMKHSTSSSRDITTQNFYDDLPGFITGKISTYLISSNPVQLQ